MSKVSPHTVSCARATAMRALASSPKRTIAYTAGGGAGARLSQRDRPLPPAQALAHPTRESTRNTLCAGVLFGGGPFFGAFLFVL